jgi:hypothetical protein
MDPLLQLPGINNDFVNRLIQGSKSRKDSLDSFRALRSLPRDDAATLLKQLSKCEGGGPVQPILDSLFSTPLIAVEDLQVTHEVHKATGKSVGTLKVTLDIQRGNNHTGKNGDDRSLSLSLVLGSFNNRALLGHSVLQIARNGKWSVTKEIEFDWSAANADGGEGGGSMILRLILEEVRGLDSELIVGLGS